MTTSIELMSTPVFHSNVAPKSRRFIVTGRPASERLSILTVSGGSGDASVMLMVAHIADYMSVPVGAAEASGLWIDTRDGQQGDAEPSEVAVFMSAREGRSEEIAEAARRGATLLLNADDPRLCEAASEGNLAEGGASSRVAYFSADPSSPVIRAHREAGGLAYVLQGGWIIEARGASEKRVVRASEIQTPLGGTARHEITNALAAVAAARAAGFGVAEILCALRTFERASVALAG